MAAFDLGGVFAVDDYRLILGDVFVGEMNHNVVPLEICLQCPDIYIGYCSTCFECKTRGFTCRLTGEDCGRDNAYQIPSVACTVGTSTGGDDIRRVASCKTSEGYLEEVTAVLKVIDSTY